MSRAVPDTWEELREQFQDGTVELDELVHYFDADTRCTLCGEATVSFYSLPAAIVKHYELKDDAEVYEIVMRELHSSDYDNSDETGGLCNYHHYVLNKDD